MNTLINAQLTLDQNLDWYLIDIKMLIECQWSANGGVEKCQSNIDQVSIKYIHQVSITGIDPHSTTMRVLIHIRLWMSLEHMIQMLHISDHIYGPLVFGQKVHIVITPNIYLFGSKLRKLPVTLEGHTASYWLSFPTLMYGPDKTMWAMNQMGKNEDP